ncbi:shikimate kinase [Fructobacillus durionis]|uniref:Shikimate kinase n=1 Tax=Fructobacillus durionis TaxID=283737 RepID=A0A1I1FN45_9LACO|nr:shikimate kinase [Fructobacillus durionis]SFC00754.1 shikimate kinase [Fructobacillus durionis]
MNNPILIGFMGSGKTTVGRELAKELNIPFSDLDLVIEERIGHTIPEFFSSQGEAAFRKIEADQLIAELDSENILATGGGTACQAVNQEILIQHDRPVIWLQPSDETTIANLSGEDWGKRPILADKSVDDLIALKESRQEKYGKTADLIIKVDQKTPEEIAKEIIEELKNV